MSEITRIVSDMDGTLVQNQLVISEAVPSTIARLQAHNVAVSIVTGRGYHEILKTIKTLGLQGPSVFEGGAEIVDCDNAQTLWSQKLNPELTEMVVETIRPYCTVLNWGPGDTEPNMINRDATAVTASSVWAPMKLADAERIASELNQHPDLAVHLSIGMGDFTGLTNVQITRKNADKYHGVLALLELTHTNQSQIMAIGDSDNDLPLFKAAALKIAMGNASPALKKAANHITDGVENDGFVTAVDRFVLS